MAFLYPHHGKNNRICGGVGRLYIDPNDQFYLFSKDTNAVIKLIHKRIFTIEVVLHLKEITS